jgi:hypothetical protein
MHDPFVHPWIAHSRIRVYLASLSLSLSLCLSLSPLSLRLPSTICKLSNLLVFSPLLSSTGT